MKKYFFIAIIFIAAASLAQVKQTVTKSTVTYEIKNMGINTHGNFSGLKADINFDEKHLSTSSIEASIDATSINSDNTMRDNHLKSEDYFDVAKYPKITMKSVSFKSKGGGNYTGIFNVTIKDKTKPVEVAFSYTDGSKTGVFKGSFTLNRKDFGVGGSSMMLANEAKVDITAETSK
ncbi:YceI family protein [Mucilaginibacter ginkgonis]|uniref:YceI family protein n=1 Tax=Mucilaginibacter ginkgonis TaxID=2682091 RepID=A0A6I4INB0_9SPHI|nr:YceI family protein [Mucilaginibacter ginkgonis]QQL49574.1 YceI family protein [Mucilaginibacter ginkgonis]